MKHPLVKTFSYKMMIVEELHLTDLMSIKI